MGRSRYKVYEIDQPHFLTATVVRWLPVFAHPPAARVVLDALGYLQREGRLTLYAYVIMENHLHLIAAADDLRREMRAFKSYTARKIIDWLHETKRRAMLDAFREHKQAHKKDRLHQFWQEGNHPQQIQGAEMLRQKLEYLHGNPVRRGYVEEAIHWRYSSARNYAGLPGLLEVTLAL
ncbi:REP-associated tyrosine transposase [Rhodocaloribacter sp.]